MRIEYRTDRMLLSLLQTNMLTMHFDRTKAVDAGPFPFGTRPLEFLERGSDPAHEAARVRVERMLAKYPKAELEPFLCRLHAREAAQSNDAFFELFILDLFVARGYKLLGVEQPLPHTAYVVDFTFESPAGKPFLVEVVSYNQPREAVGVKKLLAEVFNTVDSVENLEYQVKVLEITGAPTQAVRKKPLKARVVQWLGQLPANSNATHVFEMSEDFAFTLAAVPRNPTGRSGLLIAAPPEGPSPNAVEGIRRKLYEKAFKYGELRVPLIVALNVSAEIQATPELFEEAVFGPVNLEAPMAEYVGYPGEYVPPGGALLEQGGPLSRVPAVLGFRGINPLAADIEKGALYQNAYAPTFDLSALGITTVNFSGGHSAPLQVKG